VTRQDAREFYHESTKGRKLEKGFSCHFVLSPFRVFVIAFLVLALAHAGAHAAPAKQQVVKKVLDNGLTVIVKPEEGSGLVAIAATVRVGVGQESIQTAGLGNFVSRLLLASTRAKSAEQVASIADEVGGNIGTEYERDMTSVRTVTTSVGFDRAMNLIGECLTEANFESKWVEQQRKDLLASIKTGSDDLFDKAYSDLQQLLYEDNGYRRPKGVSERAISLATPQDLQQFFSKYYAPNNIVLSIAGDVTAEHAIDRVNRAFAGVVPHKLPLDRGVPDEALDRPRFRASEEDVSTAYLLVGWLAPAVGSADYPAVAVAANALGGGKGSLMFQELRQKQGIGYEIGTLYPKLRYQSHVVAYVVTDPFKNAMPGVTADMTLDDARTALIKLVDSLKEKPLSAEDLERAKGYTIGTYALSHQHLLDRAILLGWAETVGVGYEFDSRFADQMQAVTAADVQRVARKYFANYAAVVLLPKSKSEPSGK
jgi:zinc protease